MVQDLVITEEFDHALELLHSGDNLFVTGKAGTGKSTLIRHFLETTERRTLTVASTGVAALNVEGYTIHRLFSFPTSVDEDYVRAPRYYPARFRKALRELDTLIIDEVSMVRADLFDAVAIALERFGPSPGEPFGGVQLVLVGDLYQLPPVVHDTEVAYIEARYDTPYFFSAHAFRRDSFPVVELTTVFRQVGDTRLVDILNSVREGALLDEARAELNARTDPGFEPPLDEFWLTLATTNRIVGSRNRLQLQRLPDEPTTYRGTRTGDLDGFELPTDEELELAVGAQVMLLNNDPSDRWVNGSLGRVTRLATNGRDPLVHVRFPDGRVEQVRPHTWEITRPVVEGPDLSHEVVGAFTQLPMKLAWAITIHKSQGQTLDRVVVDLTGGTFANGQLYVALSRCRSLDGLVLRRDVLPRDLKSDIRIRRFVASTRSPSDALGQVHLAALTVGNEGGRYRPRPVEIAVVTDDGDEASTVINPTSDLYEARTDYGLTTRDVQLAPLLAEAWHALSPLLAGRVPAGVGVDDLLGLLDFELKRNGVVDALPLGVDIPDGLLTSDERSRLAAPTALERARAQRDASSRLSAAGLLPEAGGSGPFAQLAHGRGYLLARTTGADGTVGPEGFVVGGNISTDDDPAQILADELRRAWDRVVDKDQTLLDRLHDVERHFGVEVVPADFELAGPAEASSVLTSGARVCFTGTVVAPSGDIVSRERMEEIAEQRGLVPVPNVTKTRTDVLVVAERGTQSSKSRNAAKWGKPVLDAEEFLDWASSS